MSATDSLAGLSVLVTRPAGQADTLAAAIQQAGGQASQFPLLVIQPVQDAARQALARERIQDLDHYQILLFISTNAVHHALDWIDRYWPQFPPGIEVIAIGPATAAALAGLPLEVHTADSGMQSEDILALPVLNDVAGKKIALFRGVGGRELLADTLRARGAQVDYIETYQRQPPAESAERLLQVLRDQHINVISLTSAQMLANLCALLDIKQHRINLLPLVVPSERTREAALVAGFERVVVSEGATDAATVAALASIPRRAPAV